METPRDRVPTPEEAGETLRQLTADENSVRYPPLPRWFFAAMAALVGGLHLAHLLPPSDTRHATFAIVVASVVLGGRYWLFRPGVAGVNPDLPDMLPFMAALLSLFAVGWAGTAATGAEGIWVATAVGAAAVVLVTGRRYRREFGDGR
jgi:hypothetical protein